MWDSVTAVDESHAPIIYEGSSPKVVIVVNAGPGNVEILSWDSTKPDLKSPPIAKLELRPGNTKAISGSLVRANLRNKTSNDPSSSIYAAIGWRIEP